MGVGNFSERGFYLIPVVYGCMYVLGCIVIQNHCLKWWIVVLESGIRMYVCTYRCTKGVDRELWLVVLPLVNCFLILGLCA